VLRGWRSTWLVPLLALSLSLLVPTARAKAQEPAPTSAVSYPGGVHNLRDVSFAPSLTLDLYLPPSGPARRPLVVFVHGGAWRSKTSRDGGAFLDFPSVLASVAARNYVVASANYRFSAEATFPGAVQDVASAIRWLRAQADRYGIDTGRVVVWGSSAGGQIAALLGTACGASVFGLIEGVCVQGVIDWYGLVDLEADGKDLGKPDVPDYVEAYVGCKLAHCAPGWARSASPFPYIDSKDPPFLIQHGAADVTVAPAQSKRLYDALRAAGVPAELVIYPGVAHGFSKVPGGGPDDAINKQAMDKVFEYLGRYFPTDRKM
jgi:acetyl esterase/lipase